MSEPVRRTTTTFSTDGDLSRLSSTACFSGISLPRRQPPSAVTTSLAWASLFRSATASALKPPKMIECGAPIRAQASIAIASSGIIGMYKVTRSPVSTPSFFNTFANRQTSRCRSWYRSTLESPSSPSQMIAALFFRQVSRWRSRQLALALSLPPVNHFVSGISPSTTWSNGSIQSRFPAISPQNPAGSSLALCHISSYCSLLEI